ncbi:HPP family-domain-containing protein [Scheffersomyces amazonensis]|uniref:HPP family-domain-containing protein n=1 Tax=Scheffersomyces amazonensis TaxID=1078765 RepID=UPI00315CB2A0
MVFKFTIDDVVNKHIPPNRLDRLPNIIGRFLGAHKTTPKHDYLIWLEIFLGSFCGIALIEGVFKSNTAFTAHNAPLIIASYGASAILCFNASQAPLAQPRNVLIGHFISALIGICIQKLFSLSERGRDNYWASGALSVAVASVAMSILNCVHPPAGASALLPSADESIRAMSWWYLPAHLVSSVLIISVALITGNIIRKYPVYWWTPAPVGKAKVEPEPEPAPAPASAPVPSEEENKLSSSAKAESISSSEDVKEGITSVPGLKYIQISGTETLVPADYDLDELTTEWLNEMRNKLQSLIPKNDSPV